MEIENATEKDIPRIIEMDREAFGAGAVTELTIESQLQAFPQGVFVAREMGQVVGVVCCERHSEEKFPFYDHNVSETNDANGDSLYLSVITVAEKFRNRGAGSKLLKAVEDLAEELEIGRIYCPVNKKHPYLDKGVLHFWQKNNYKIVGTTHWELSPSWFIDSYIFQRSLGVGKNELGNESL